MCVNTSIIQAPGMTRTIAVWQKYECGVRSLGTNAHTYMQTLVIRGSPYFSDRRGSGRLNGIQPR
jgi:hypothetical protein